MRKFLILAIIVIVVAVVGYFIANNLEENTQEVSVINNNDNYMQAESGTFVINQEKSIITWAASKIIGNGHVGTINIKNGEAEIENGNIKKASLTIDMDSIKDEDNNEALIKHLKSDDFFSVASFPESTFVLSSVVNGEIVGDLTIKGITNEIKVPGEIKEENGEYVIESDLIIDRTLWDIRFGSGKFFTDLGDKAIKDGISLKVRLVVEKA